MDMEVRLKVTEDFEGSFMIVVIFHQTPVGINGMYKWFRDVRDNLNNMELN